MRIAFTVPSFYPFVGGVETYVFSISRELVSLGCDIVVFSPNRVAGQRVSRDLDTVGGVEVRYVHVPIELSYRARVWPRLAKELARIGSGVDLIHCIGDGHFHSLVSPHIASKLGKPLVVTTYGPLYLQTEYSVLKKPFFDFYDAFIDPYVFRRASAVCIRFPELRDWAIAHGARKNSIYLTPSGLSKEFLEKVDGKLFMDRFGLDPPIVLYVGRLTPQKGVHYFVASAKQVASEIPDAKFVVVGPDQVGFRPYLEALAQKLGVDKNLVFLDPIRDALLEMSAYAACDVFAMYSAFEGFSQAVVKAMAQEKPVVVSQVGGLPYEVSYGRCGVVVPYGSAEKLGKAILEVLSNPAYFRDMARRARERAKLFTFDKLARDLLNVYEKLV